MSREPQAPPLPVGTRVRYTGSAFGHWRDSRDPDSIVWVQAGDVGEVVATHEGLPAIPGIDPEPLDGWSTVRFGTYAGNDRALHWEDFTPCADGPEQAGECSVHQGHFDGRGATCSRAGRYEVLR